MGVNLTGIVPAGQVELSDLRGRRIAIDAHNSLYQFLSIIRDRFTGEPLKDSNGEVTSHLSGLFYRTARLMDNGIKPIYVFDGKPPEFKHDTVVERSRIRQEAREKLEKAREEGDVEKIRLYAQQSMRLTADMVEESKKLLLAMGVPVVQAPSEGEAQAAVLAREGVVWASGSQDWDSLLFGTPRMIKNLAISGKRKVAGKEDYTEVRPEIIELKPILSELGITREQLIIIGILIGTDYNPKGVKGIGPKKALHMVREDKTLDRVMSEVEWEFTIPPEKIFDFFMNPPAEKAEVAEVKPDLEELRKIMLSHDFSGERIDGTMERLRRSCSPAKGTLHCWLR